MCRQNLEMEHFVLQKTLHSQNLWSSDEHEFVLGGSRWHTSGYHWPISVGTKLLNKLAIKQDSAIHSLWLSILNFVTIGVWIQYYMIMNIQWCLLYSTLMTYLKIIWKSNLSYFKQPARNPRYSKYGIALNSFNMSDERRTLPYQKLNPFALLTLVVLNCSENDVVTLQFALCSLTFPTSTRTLVGHIQNCSQSVYQQLSISFKDHLCHPFLHLWLMLNTMILGFILKHWFCAYQQFISLNINFRD